MLLQRSFNRNFLFWKCSLLQWLRDGLDTHLILHLMINRDNRHQRCLQVFPHHHGKSPLLLMNLASNISWVSCNIHTPDSQPWRSAYDCYPVHWYFSSGFWGQPGVPVSHVLKQQFYIISPFDGPRTPKRTSMACQFCRGKDFSSLVSSWQDVLNPYQLGRKLKCDGIKPSCANCDRRRYPCTYAPVSGWGDKVNA